MRKFREKIMRKFRKKNSRKFCEKNENYAKKTQKNSKKIHSLIVMVARMYCGRTDRKDS